MLPVSDDDMASIANTRVKNKLFAHRNLEGTVAVRLNLHHRLRKFNETFHIQSVHAGASPRGRVLGYDHAVTVRNASFYVDASAQRHIAAGAHKRPMAAVVGTLSKDEPTLEGVAIRFNPRTGAHFVRVDDGRAVLSAEEVTVFDTRAYARGDIRYQETYGNR